MKPVVVLTTVGRDFDAAGLARSLVEARLAACVNILPSVHSIYRWEGTIADDAEQLLLVKTVDTRLDALRSELDRLHPYDVPEFVVLEISDISEAYGAWLHEGLRIED